MKRVENERFMDGQKRAVLDLQVSTASDLPALGSKIDNMIVCAGSIAQIIQTGVFATLDDDGKWYSGGSEVS